LKRLLIALLGIALICVTLSAEPKTARTDKFSTVSSTWYETKFEEQKIVEYKILWNGSQTKLSEEVTKYLKDGWHLYGSPTISTSGIAQAVVRYE